MIKYIQVCRGCQNPDLAPVFKSDVNHFLHGSFHYPGKEPPPKRQIPLEVVRCNVQTKYDGCGLVQLKHEVSPEVLYNEYGYKSSQTLTMTKHLKNLVDDVSLLFDNLNNRTVLDIGCNDGYTLSCFPEQMVKYGIDPCLVAKNVNLPNTTIINECFPSDKLHEKKFDICLFLACFYDINCPVDTLMELQYLLSDDGILVIEMGYLVDVLERCAYDYYCQEHLACYSITTLEWMLEQAGLKIFRINSNSINGGSIQVWITHRKQDKYDKEWDQKVIKGYKFYEFDMALDTEEPYAKFRQKILQHKIDTLKFIEQVKQENKTVHLLGASTKTNLCLQELGLNNNDIAFASERSKEKVGGKTLGTNIPIISEEESRSKKPDYYLSFIYFKDEILKREEEALKSGVRFVFPLPSFQVYDYDRYVKEYKS